MEEHQLLFFFSGCEATGVFFFMSRGAATQYPRSPPPPSPARGFFRTEQTRRWLTPGVVCFILGVGVCPRSPGSRTPTCPHPQRAYRSTGPFSSCWRAQTCCYTSRPSKADCLGPSGATRHTQLASDIWKCCTVLLTLPITGKARCRTPLQLGERKWCVGSSLKARVKTV